MKKLFFTIAIVFAVNALSAQPDTINTDGLEETWIPGQNAEEMQVFDAAILKAELNKLTRSEKQAVVVYAGLSILIIPLFLLVTGSAYREKREYVTTNLPG